MPVTPLPSLIRTSPTFKVDLDNFFLTQLPGFQVQVNSLVDEVQTDADTASNAAALATTKAAEALASKVAAETAQGLSLQYSNAAAAATVASGAAPAFISGQTYALGAVVFSTLNLLTYRCAVAGTHTVDPSLDPVNWRGLDSAGGRMYFLSTM